MRKNSRGTAHLKAIDAWGDAALCGKIHPQHWMPVRHERARTHTNGREWFLQRKDEFTLCSTCAELSVLAELGSATL
jgi:hypothetical protein